MVKEANKFSFGKIFREMAIKPSYWLIAILSIFLFYIVNILITNFHLLLFFFKKEGFIQGLQLFINITLTFHKTILPFSLASLLVIGLLIGVLVCLMTYNFKNKYRELKNTSFVSFIGLFFGFLAPGCAPCGIGLIGAFGIASAFTTLPWQGKEVSLIAIMSLLFSIVLMIIKISTPIVCNFNYKSHTNERRLNN